MVLSKLPVSDPVFYCDPSVDLTDAVIDDLRRKLR